VSLDEYRKKRNFGRTPEPEGRPADRGQAARERRPRLFVIQKHAASRLHYDLRLELDGVFRSWAVPRGLSLDPGDRHLAVEVEDHPLEYGRFEGVIPEGEYGGGTVMLWDRGTWLPGEKFTDDHIDFELSGSKLRGSWSLIRMRGEGKDGSEWLVMRRGSAGTPAAQESLYERSIVTGRTMEQIAADRDATWSGEERSGPGPASLEPAKLSGAREGVLPTEVTVQLPTLVEDAPGGTGWLHEIKFDGYRIVTRLDRSQPEPVLLRSRNGLLWTERFPELAVLLGNLEAQTALLDGEVVAYKANGSTSFGQLQEALGEERTANLVYQVFDLLHLDGYDLRSAPLLERKELLRELLERSGFRGQASVRYTDHLSGQGPAFLERVCGLGLEGIVSKRSDAPYESGRGRSWLKAKCSNELEVVIGGFTKPSGSRVGFGALLTGAYTPDGTLRYTGKVGTGFSDRQLELLHERLEELERKTSPFEPAPKLGRGVHWVEPRLVARVEYSEWTRDGSLRHPTFRGLREDVDPQSVRHPNLKSGAPGEGRGEEQEKMATTGKPARKSDGSTSLMDVRLSSPDKVLYPEHGITKLQLAHYYEEIQEWIMPWIAQRPLSLVRCPSGYHEDCFFQKHPSEGLFDELARVTIEEEEGSEEYLYIDSPDDLVALVQGGVLELHVWGSRVDDLERPDLLVFDLDPAPDIQWGEMLRVARELRERLAQLDLTAFLRTTGGKGLHLVVPLEPVALWPEVKEFARAVAQAAQEDDRTRITTNMSKAKRKGKIFLDYLRNGRGATAIASYSTRAKEGATVAVPLRWEELGPTLGSDRYNLANIRRRLSALKSDPWEGWDEARRKLDGKLLGRLGVGG